MEMYVGVETEPAGIQRKWRLQTYVMVVRFVFLTNAPYLILGVGCNTYLFHFYVNIQSYSQ